MRRSTQLSVSYSELSEHIPKKWRERVKVSRTETSKISIKDAFSITPGIFSDLTSVPHLDEDSPYKERWELGNIEDEGTSHLPQFDGFTKPSTSSSIPGALVVDPYFRKIAKGNGLEVNNNAAWVLTIALKEHLKNILNDSIKLKEGLENSETYPRSLHHPNLLSSVAQKIKKASKEKTSAPIAIKGKIDSTKQINTMDILLATNMLPSGNIESTGGSFSRMCREQSFIAAFTSVPEFVLSDDFRFVQDFVSDSILDLAKKREAGDKKGRHRKKQAVNRSSSRINSADLAEEKDKTSNPPSVAGEHPPSVAGEHPPAESCEETKTKDTSTSKDPTPRPERRGSGSGSKNLAELKKRFYLPEPDGAMDKNKS